MNIIFIIGMPGVGKTTIGSRWAQQHGMEFTDMDALIQEKYSLSVPDIFEKYGEEVFRSFEHETLKELITSVNNATIVSCGGGTPCFMNNIELMKNSGTVLWLHIPINILTQQILNDTHTNRPLLLRYNKKAWLYICLSC